MRRSVGSVSSPMPTGTLWLLGPHPTISFRNKPQAALLDLPLCGSEVFVKFRSLLYDLYKYGKWKKKKRRRRNRMHCNLVHQVHFLSICRAIMEHKELLKVPWDWQIGKGFAHLRCCAKWTWDICLKRTVGGGGEQTMKGFRMKGTKENETLLSF